MTDSLGTFRHGAKMVRVVSLRSVVALLLLGVLSACSDGMCKNTPLKRAASPDGQYEAVAFQRDCGATTGASTQVSIIEAGSALPDKPGNVMVSDDPFPADVKWGGDRQLTVHHDRAARLSKRVDRYEGVSVTFEDGR